MSVDTILHTLKLQFPLSVHFQSENQLEKALFIENICPAVDSFTKALFHIISHANSLVLIDSLFSCG